MRLIYEFGANAIIFAAFISPITVSVAAEQLPTCPGKHPPVELPQAMQANFKKVYCGRNVSVCDRRWGNFSLLYSMIAKDERLTSIPLVSTVMATVMTETFSKDLAPDTVEFPPNKNKVLPQYWIKDPVTHMTYQGRGWGQLTHADRYKWVGKQIGMGDKLYKNPSLALRPDISYKVLVGGLLYGWHEQYRKNEDGQQLIPTVPIRITDFIAPLKVDYMAARTATNANCDHRTCKDRYVEGKGFIPLDKYITRGEDFRGYAMYVEKWLCSSDQLY
ncbi:hypothetical protein LOY28_16760 [Pseudomonas sp. B21-017]|uniref:hypothetical protein n=1 Tax=Pseudomonas sp. B21-017 TaxID=2895474 RepID=UPI00215DD7E2|nr:hypothetical protein [Pseudomonas sp. B21-017]UVM36378.1 hypothetical protein LOY28_16760 [Pseudomonas sp. B21-017]